MSGEREGKIGADFLAAAGDHRHQIGTLTDMGTDKEDSAFDPDQDKPARRSQPSANVRKKGQNPVSKVIDALPSFADKHSVLFGLILIGVIVFLVYLIQR